MKSIAKNIGERRNDLTGINPTSQVPSLKDLDCDWTYSFPQTSVISAEEIKEGLGIEEQENPADYNPNKVFEEKRSAQRRKRSWKKFA